MAEPLMEIGPETSHPSGSEPERRFVVELETDPGDGYYVWERKGAFCNRGEALTWVSAYAGPGQRFRCIEVLFDLRRSDAFEEVHDDG